MNGSVKLPIGIENFEEIRTEGFYYVDKTGLIKELLHNWGKVNLFTRPRRFGKSLNMSMLKIFFEYGCDSRLFDGLEIAEERKLCEDYMGRFPVISLTLKGVDGRNYKTAKGMLYFMIRSEALRFYLLKDSPHLTGEEKADYSRLLHMDEWKEAEGGVPEEILADSLCTLCRLLQKHYGQKVILLIDEYDVPLDKAQQAGYYDEMVSLIRNLFGQALKTNDSLYFAVLTGCLRIAKESIFTGLNNLKVLTITDDYFDEHFGFSDAEVRDMLGYYGLEDKYELTKTWYDGYRFGNADVYCPWDVINYVDKLRANPNTQPSAFWINTSGNDIIRAFLRKAGPGTKKEIERLIAGESIPKAVDQELTYRDLYKSMDNLWSVLFTTGYLTQRGEPDGKVLQLAIPNLEIREIFVEQVMEWFRDETRRDTPKLDAFCAAFLDGDAEAAETQLNAYLAKTISIRDTAVRKNRKENFYHGILLGLLSHREDWYITSNAESGNKGILTNTWHSDILLEDEERSIGIVIEVKYAEDGNLEKGCAEALEQVGRMEYEAGLRQDGMETVLVYGIACNRKKCRVRGL